jgi:transcriptional regulator with XRE-family HTH domain
MSINNILQYNVTNPVHLLHSLKMKQSLKDIFIHNLKYYRNRKGFSQEKLSNLLNKGFNYINTIECGKSMPPIDMIEQIASVLEVDPALLFKADGCPVNTILYNKETFIQQISEGLNEQVRKSIENVLLSKI